MVFKALIDFYSSELKSQYVQNGIYTVLNDTPRLALYVEKWLEAQRFTPREDFTILGMEFKSGKESYYLQDDALKDIILQKVNDNLVDLTEIGLITFDVPAISGAFTGELIRTIGGNV